MPNTSDAVDFFISYNVHDERWATWIAWVLEQEGFRCVIQSWDFRPGGNFVLEMQQASTRASRTLAVLSSAYLGSNFGASEWAAEFASDPTGELRRLVPVRVEPCDIPGLLKQITYIDLVGLDEDDAATVLRAGLAPGRAKPLKAPTFPGVASRETRPVDQPPTLAKVGAEVAWQPLQSPVPVTWHRLNRSQGYATYGTVLEVALVPMDAVLVEARRLRSLGDQLTNQGRQAGLFSNTQAVSAEVHGSGVLAMSQSRDDDTGLWVTREGQRGAWFRLPHDSMGAIFDPEDLTPRLAAVIKLLAQLPIDHFDRFAVGAGLTALALLTVGDVGVLGRRTSATMSFTSRNDVIVPANESVGLEAIQTASHDVAEEVVARLELALQSR